MDRRLDVIAQEWSAPGNDSGAYTSDLDKATLHSTEGGSIEGAIAAYRANNSWPHGTIDYRHGRRRIARHLRHDRAARSLRNTTAPGQTNRDGTLQYELVGNAAQILAQYDENDWIALGADIIGPDCRAAGIPLVCQVTMPTYPPPNGERLGRESTRLTHAQMAGIVGLVGHCNWPENTHGDPGPLTQPYYRNGTTSAIDLILEGAGATIDPPKGPLMALTDAEQTELLTKVRDLHRETGLIAGFVAAVLEAAEKVDFEFMGTGAKRLRDRAGHLNPFRKK
jgi:hypothetical protein